jgi:hypothetical protein
MYGAVVIGRGDNCSRYQLGFRAADVGCMVRRIKGIVRAVLTIAGAISLSSPLLAPAAGPGHHREPARQKDQQGGDLSPSSLASNAAAKVTSKEVKAGNHEVRSTEKGQDATGVAR